MVPHEAFLSKAVPQRNERDPARARDEEPVGPVCSVVSEHGCHKRRKDANVGGGILAGVWARVVVCTNLVSLYLNVCLCFNLCAYVSLSLWPVSLFLDVPKRELEYDHPKQLQRLLAVLADTAVARCVTLRQSQRITVPTRPLSCQAFTVGIIESCLCVMEENFIKCIKI